jgi:hypothetical protein
VTMGQLHIQAVILLWCRCRQAAWQALLLTLSRPWRFPGQDEVSLPAPMERPTVQVTRKSRGYCLRPEAVCSEPDHLSAQLLPRLLCTQNGPPWAR